MRPYKVYKSISDNHCVVTSKLYHFIKTVLLEYLAALLIKVSHHILSGCHDPTTHIHCYSSSVILYYTYSMFT